MKVIILLVLLIADIALKRFFSQSTSAQSAIMHFFFFFLCGKHHWGCVAPNADISLQSGRFWATVIASSRERLFDLRSCWIVFIHVVRGRTGGHLQFSEGEAVMILLASVSSGILAMWPNRERRRAWTIVDTRQAWLPGCPSPRGETIMHSA